MQDYVLSAQRPPRPAAEAVSEVAAVTGGLGERLTEEMVRRWWEGERPLAEEFLSRHPELWQQPETALDLIYEEFCLRQEYGEETTPEEVCHRFPGWRAELEILIDCHRLLETPDAAPRLPTVGESLGDFHLLAELGRGAQGCVFLASQPALADRRVVLKVTPRDGQEHLSLARLQHTHIVPLYSVQEEEGRNLRVLCMPYFGSATLARLLDALQPVPLGERSGRHLLDALDQAEAVAPAAVPAQQQARQVFAQASYVQAVCWTAACLAEALHYAHERGLVHLDLKPSNVLLAADGQPMLLDFHLARPPLSAGEPAPDWLGGTLAYMAPEQHAALAAVRERRPVPLAVDGRADIFALGALMYGALGGQLPVQPGVSPPLQQINLQVSPGLSDLVHKCLADHARDRYATAAALAADLHRHLADLPLQGVRNRSPAERWRKWRRRRPAALALLGMLLAVCLTAVGVGSYVLLNASRQEEQARAALDEGVALTKQGQHAAAASTFKRGLALALDLPLHTDLQRELREHLLEAEQAEAAAGREQAVRALHRMADQLRFVHGADHLTPADLRQLEQHCRALWDRRGLILERLGPGAEAEVKNDLLDLAVLWTDLRIRLAAAGETEAVRREGLRVLADAAALFGPTPVLTQEYQTQLAFLGRADRGEWGMSDGSPRAPRTAWEHYALGRSLLRPQLLLPLPAGCAGELFLLGQGLVQTSRLALAAVELERARVLEPRGVWPNFYAGLCAYRLGRYEDAVSAFSVCIGLTPENAGFFHNRALAYAAQGRAERAWSDHHHARQLGIPIMRSAAPIHYNLALAQLAAGDRAAALESLRQASELPAARQLYDNLRPRTKPPQGRTSR